MTCKSITLTLDLCSIGLFAQEAPVEPEYSNQYYALKDGKLERLEHAELKLQNKTSNYFVTVKGSSLETVKGTQSILRVGPDAHFIVRMHSGDIDPATMVKLRPFKVGKNDRELLMHSVGAHIFGGVNGKAADDNSIAVTIKKYGSNSFEVIPSQPLAPGEYFFTAMGMEADCFGVDAK